MNENDVRDFFNNFSENYERNIFFYTNGTEYLSKTEIDFVLENMNSYFNNNDNNILEIGVGTGRIAKAVLSNFAHTRKYVGVDISKKMVLKSKNKSNDSDFEIVLCDAGRKLPFNNSSFDMVLCIRNLKYIRNWEHTIQEISRLLKPGGMLILEIANIYSIALFGSKGTKYFLFKPKEVIKSLEKNGITCMLSKGMHRIPFPIYKKLNNQSLLKILMYIEFIFSKFLPSSFLSRSIFLVCKRKE